MRKNAPPPHPLGYIPFVGIFFISLLYLVGAFEEWQVREYLWQHGTLTEATIVERSEAPRNFYVKYSFTPSGKGVAMTQRESVNVFYYSTYLKGTDKVSILYNAADPEMSRIAGNNNFVASGSLALGGIGLAVYGVVMLTKILLKLHKETQK